MLIKRIRIITVIAAVCFATAMLTQPAYAYQKETKMNEQFLNAVTKGDVAKVKEMLRADPALAQARDQKGVSAILKATYNGKKEVAAEILATGVQLNIFEAAATGQTERVKTLIKQDVSLVNAFSPDGFMPLGLAVFFGHGDTVEALLAAGAEVNTASRESMKVTPLHSAAAARQTAIAKVLIDHGADVNSSQAESGFTPLHEAALNGDIELARLLLERGAKINAKMTDGKTPLVFALESRQSEMAKFLEERGGVK
ncbi:MAG TPA: ankyrin repeat domain-containing protein [Blastocatellia bacterium]|nr:ankyrin repeat domain-containing protein [Blastocatellia bacterium]